MEWFGECTDIFDLNLPLWATAAKLRAWARGPGKSFCAPMESVAIFALHVATPEIVQFRWKLGNWWQRRQTDCGRIEYVLQRVFSKGRLEHMSRHTVKQTVDELWNLLESRQPQRSQPDDEQDVEWWPVMHWATNATKHSKCTFDMLLQALQQVWPKVLMLGMRKLTGKRQSGWLCSRKAKHTTPRKEEGECSMQQHAEIKNGEITQAQTHAGQRDIRQTVDSSDMSTPSQAMH
jgi:hypothetical protein